MTDGRTPTTTVVVITHNYGRYLATAVASVVQQTVQPRVLVMDDGSTDGTDELMRDLAKRYPLLTCHRSEQPRGLAATRNDAARRAETEWIIYLDADDWLDRQFVESGERWIARHPECDVLTTDTTVIRQGRTPKVARARAPESWRCLLRRNTVRQTSFIRRSMILALSGYDGAFAYEDWEFWIRALKGGYRIDRLPGAHVFHRQHGLNHGAATDPAPATRAIWDRHGAPTPWEALRLRLTGW
jgi:glycosyltransferase involved in cell wall biosynthesis